MHIVFVSCIHASKFCFVINVTALNTWSSPCIRGEGPEAREGHSAALVGKRLFIFGGCGKSSSGSHEEYYDDLYILNTGEPLCILDISNHLTLF